MIGPRLELHAGEFGHGMVANQAISHHQAVERLIVEDKRFAVAADLQIAFDRIMTVDGSREGAFGVLDDVLLRIMEPAMGDRPGDEPVQIEHGG